MVILEDGDMDTTQVYITGSPATGGTEFIGADELKGYINIELQYDNNYTSTNNELPVFANINSNDSVTIATDLGEVTGIIVLKYSNNGKVFASQILNVPGQNQKIFYKIDGDTSWYTDEWQVQAYNMKEETISPLSTVQFYTVKDESGLRGLAEATTNESAKTEGRKFYLIHDIDVGSSNFTPINADTTNRFKGRFSGSYTFDSSIQWVTSTGAYNTISNINITSTNDDYHYGLFGLIDGNGTNGNGTVENFNLSNVTITNNGTKTTGTVVGWMGGSSSINNVTVSNSNITGKATTGGIVGSNRGSVNNCIFNGKVTSQAASYTCGIGGVAGVNIGNIINNKCTGEVTGGNNSYNIGGIVGHNNCDASKVVENNSFEGTKVEGGANCHNIGGIVGFNGKYTGSGMINTSDSTIRYLSSNKLSVGKVAGGNNSENIGGIAGCSVNGNFSNNECVREVTGGNNSKNIGGIVGYSIYSYFENNKCLNATIKSGAESENTGGVIGFDISGYTIRNTCEGSTIESGDKSYNTGGIIGKTASEGKIYECN